MSEDTTASKRGGIPIINYIEYYTGTEEYTEYYYGLS